jgi:putative membrane fusion protein
MIKTYVVTYGNIEDCYNDTGYVIRNEEVIKTGVSVETLKPVKNEGERVARGSVIATISRQSLEGMQQKIGDIDDKIKSAVENQAKNNIGAQIFSEDIRKVDEDNNQEVENLCAFANDNDFSNAIKIKTTIDNNLKKRAEISGELGPASQYILGLINEKKSYESNISALEEKIRANETGVVSYNIDGLENILKPSRIPSIDINQLERLNEQKNNDNNNSTSGIKIVDNFECYIAVIFKDEKKLKEIKVGQLLELRLIDFDEELIPVYVDSITDKGNGIRLVAFRTNQKVDELLKYRKVNIDIVWSDSKGLKIPISSIVYKDGEQGVMAVKTDYAKFKNIEVINKNNEYAIVKEALSSYDKGVSLYDEIILNGSNIKEGRQIRRWN